MKKTLVNQTFIYPAPLGGTPCGFRVMAVSGGYAECQEVGGKGYLFRCDTVRSLIEAQKSQQWLTEEEKELYSFLESERIRQEKKRATLKEMWETTKDMWTTFRCWKGALVTVIIVTIYWIAWLAASWEFMVGAGFMIALFAMGFHHNGWDIFD